MKMWPVDKEDWSNVLLRLPLTLLIFFSLCAMVSTYFLPEWSSNYNARYATLRLISKYSTLSALIYGVLLFSISILFACWRDWRRAFLCSFSIIACFILVIIICLPLFARAVEKPVLYLYPETEQQVHVKLRYDGALTHSYPAYPADGWTVLASPSGELTNLETGRRHYCLFWEGEDSHQYPVDEGFVVTGDDTAAFLESTLAELGLSEREANEFIIYWLPRMEKNRFNLISFPIAEYTRRTQLDITPAPETMIRVFMVFKEIDKPVDINPQHFEPITRRGFTVVEWGGSEL